MTEALNEAPTTTLEGRRHRDPSIRAPLLPRDSSATSILRARLVYDVVSIGGMAAASIAGRRASTRRTRWPGRRPPSIGGYGREAGAEDGGSASLTTTRSHQVGP